MTKWVDKEKRIDDIVAAAIEVFLEKGYVSASMESIANRANMSKGGIYHHFGSKEEILFYVNNKLNDPISAMIQTALNAADVVQGIKQYIRDYLSYWINHKKEMAFYFLTMTKALESPKMWKIYEDYYNEMTNFLISLFERGIKEGHLKEHNLKSAAVTLMSAMDGVMTYLIMNHGLSIEEVAEDLENRYINTILTGR